MEGYSFNSLQAAPGSALAGNSSSLLVQQQQPTSLISQQYYYEYHHQQQPQPQPQPTQHQQPNSTDYLFATSQNSPSIYYTSVDSTQALNSYNTDFTTNSFTAAVSNNNNNTNNNNVIYTQTAPVADFQPSTIVPESFDFGGGNFLFEESSVFLSPQASSAASSASQSPESKSQYYALSGNAAAAAATDSLDLSLEELLQNIGSEEDNIFGSIGVEDDLALSDELFEALKDVAEGEEGEEDFFSELNFEDAGLDLLSQGGSSNAALEISSNSISSISSNSSVCSASSDFFLNASFSSSSSNSSVSSTPKRKYSSDSSSSSSSSSNSTYCYSEASYQTAASNSSSSSEPEIEATAVAKQSKPASSSSNKRARRTPKASPVEKAARKKDQNKRAACRYRSKKRTELHSSELTMEELEAVRDGLAEQVRKLQTEFGVILPLARAAFAHDAAKRARLQAMLARVDGLL